MDRRAEWDANAPAWIALSRQGYDVFRDLVNTPAFLDLLPPVDGLRVLDLGCGEGHNTRLVADRGAAVVALDITEVFLRAAAEADGGRGIRYVQADGAVLPFADGSFDAVTAFMSLMDVARPEATLAEVARVLRPGGFVQLSVVHPVSSAPNRAWIEDDQGHRIALAVADYFATGETTESWTFGAAPEEERARHRPFEITYARRTVAGWLHAVLDAGLVIEAVAEPSADDPAIARQPSLARTRIVPWSLIVRARRP